VRQWAETIAGVAIVALIFYDLFQSVVLPRPSVGKLRLSTFIIRPLWVLWRWIGRRTSSLPRRENWLGTFGPIALIVLLAFWGLSIIFGYSLVIDAVADQIHPPPADFATSLYFSAGTLLPLSYGDIIPVGPVATLAVLAESATGVALIALVISLLFSLYGSFQQREELVVTLDALAGAPPSGLQILETTARVPGALLSTFAEWRGWSAAVLESHLAYPILVYFRSSHDNEAWVNSFGAVLDAATLALSTIVADDALALHADLFLKVGNHLVEDLSWYFRLSREQVPIVERQEFEAARDRLVRTGYRCRDVEDAWKEFVALRSLYALPLNQLVQRLAIVPAEWIGDRSYLPHNERSGSTRKRLSGGEPWGG
jgi:hypothetical protein